MVMLQRRGVLRLGLPWRPRGSHRSCACQTNMGAVIRVAAAANGCRATGCHGAFRCCGPPISPARGGRRPIFPLLTAMACYCYGTQACRRFASGQPLLSGACWSLGSEADWRRRHGASLSQDLVPRNFAGPLMSSQLGTSINCSATPHYRITATRQQARAIPLQVPGHPPPRN